jgi:hypothetical protein
LQLIQIRGDKVILSAGEDGIDRLKRQSGSLTFIQRAPALLSRRDTSKAAADSWCVVSEVHSKIQMMADVEVKLESRSVPPFSRGDSSRRDSTPLFGKERKRDFCGTVLEICGELLVHHISF